MITPPLDVVLDWPRPNYIDPETRGPANEIVAIILWISATSILAIRLYARKHITHGFGLDDVLIVAAWVPSTAFGICGLVCQYGYDWNRHIWDVPFDSIEACIKLALSNLLLFDISTSFTKLSMLALVYRLVACSKHNRLRILCQLLGVVISVNCLVFMLVIFLQCRYYGPSGPFEVAPWSANGPLSPFSDNWKISFGDPVNCTVNEAAHLLAAGIINTVTDFIMVLLPMGIVYRFQKLPRQQLIVVNVLFGVGFFACIAGVVRTYYTWIMSVSANYDSSWHAYMTWLFSAVELYVGLICASVPAAKPFFGRYIPQIIRSTYRSRCSKDVYSSPRGCGERRDREPRNPLSEANRQEPLGDVVMDTAVKGSTNSSGPERQSGARVDWMEGWNEPGV